MQSQISKKNRFHFAKVRIWIWRSNQSSAYENGLCKRDHLMGD